MHLDEETRQRLQDGELSASAEASARRHLAQCPDCRTALEQAQREARDVQGWLLALDDPAPAVHAFDVINRARPAAPRRTWWAAALFLAFGVGTVAYALPGSPLPGLLTELLVRIGRGSTPVPPPNSAPPAPSQAPGSAAAGIAVDPGREMLILFTSPQAAGDVGISLTTGDRIVVRGPAGEASFSSGPDRLVIRNEGSGGSFLIEVPREAPRVEIRVGSTRLFLKEGPNTAPALPPTGTGYRRFPLTP